MSLFSAMLTVRGSTMLARCKFLEPSCLDRIQLLMLAAMRHHLIRIGTDEVAFETMKVRSFILRRACNRGKFYWRWYRLKRIKLTQIRGIRAIRSTASDVSPVLLKIATHQRIESFVSRCMLNESRFIAKTIPAILPLTMEVRLVFPVPAMLILAVLVKPISKP